VPKISLKERDYVRWQNRATRFYLAARLLYFNSQYGPAAFCANQGVELMLKATVCYWDRSVDPSALNHSFAKLKRILRNKVPQGSSVCVPEYFSDGRRYQSLTRYPSKRDALIGIPASFIVDLDDVFYSLLCLVPFQFNTELRRALSGRNRRDLLILRRGNLKIRHMRSVLGQRLER